MNLPRRTRRLRFSQSNRTLERALFVARHHRHVSCPATLKRRLGAGRVLIEAQRLDVQKGSGRSLTYSRKVLKMSNQLMNNAFLKLMAGKCANSLKMGWNFN